MNSENLITLSNLAETSNNHVEKKSYSGVGTAGTIAFAIFVGVTVLRSLGQGTIVSEHDFARPSYIQCINLNQEKGFAGLYTKNAIDLMKVENISKIKKMALFNENWNGTGGRAFSENAIALFESIIEMLDKQPQIAPTGRNSLLMQYELDDKSLLAFEVSENQTEKVCIPKGNYAMAQIEIFTENVGQQIKESVKLFYGIR
ncbi:Uncharacterised protein [uncultured Blautia sp.]|nr:hypothetical protein [uncultured Blautia sp.]SCI49307.1 Uncharacterised protein [uncultured Blautia sp.]